MGYKIGLFAGIVISMFWIPGCMESSGNQENPEISINHKLGFEPAVYRSVIQEKILSGDISIWNDSLTVGEIQKISDYYRAHNFTPQLIPDLEDSGWFQKLTGFIVSAEDHGLKPEEYRLYKIRDLYQRALIPDSMDVRVRHEFLASADLLLSSSLCKLASHLKYGRVNPYTVYSDGYYLPLPDSTSRDFTAPMKSGDIAGYFRKLLYRNGNYHALVNSTRFFKDRLNLRWEKIQYISEKLKPGNQHTEISSIASRLLVLGFLDSGIVKPDSHFVYDSLLIKSLSAFQEARGLTVDGVPGKKTIDRLNLKPADYINEIYINLERMRWTTYYDTTSFVKVNIPEFKVYVYKNKKLKGSIKVCVGKKRSIYYDELYARYKKTGRQSHKPENWQTPQLYSRFNYMVLNPTWTVPPSIVREEIYSEFMKDTSYLKRKKFKVYLDNQEQPVEQVDLKKYGRENIPYIFVQSPDPYNALGKIKFMFRNPFGVYLHDTPTRAPFNYADRAVSHGCVRVEKPLLFAEYLIEDHSKWNISYIKLETGTKIDDPDLRAEYYENRKTLRGVGNDQKTTTIRMENELPLFIDYLTAWVDKDGKIQFRDDVYNKNGKLLSALLLK